MITLLINITTKNAGGVKTASVFALNDASPVAGATIAFSVLTESHIVTENFAANEGKEVSCNHTATGTGLVRATAGTALDQRFCNVDAPNCDGLAPGAILTVLPLH